MGYEVMVSIGPLGFKTGIKMLSTNLLMSCTSTVIRELTRHLMYDAWASTCRIFPIELMMDCKF